MNVFAAIFATKGIEYLLVLGYLALLVPFWLLLSRSPKAAAARERITHLGQAAIDWFKLPEKLHYHRGHTWVEPRDDGLVRVGIDDFAEKLLGVPEALDLPPAGARLECGERGWHLRVSGKTIAVLAPVRGEVVNVNREALASPELVGSDPYGRGWLLEVRVPRLQAALANLMSGAVARAWIAEESDSLRARMGGELGISLQDGGVPIPGFARQLGAENWEEIAAEYLLTN